MSALVRVFITVVSTQEDNFEEGKVCFGKPSVHGWQCTCGEVGILVEGFGGAELLTSWQLRSREGTRKGRGPGWPLPGHTQVTHFLQPGRTCTLPLPSDSLFRSWTRPWVKPLMGSLDGLPATPRGRFTDPWAPPNQSRWQSGWAVTASPVFPDPFFFTPLLLNEVNIW
jgi:hypothetical protein